MSRTRLLAATNAGAIGALLIAGGCGLHPGEAWNRTDGAYGPIEPSATASSAEDVTDQAQGLCPASSPLLPGTHAAGDVCTSPADCASTCCDCGTGSQSWLAASCVAGRCIDSLTSCSRTRARYCGSGGGLVVVAPGSANQCTDGSATTGCQACIDAHCCTETLACRASPSCVALEDCDATCTDTTCRERCYEAIGSGARELQALDACVANACGSACEP